MDVAFPRVSLIILGFSLCNICSVPEPGLLLTFSFFSSFFFRLPLQTQQFLAQISGLPPAPPQLARVVMPIAWQIRCTSVR